MIQLAILLDTSNSMDGLINQAKSELWTIVNEFVAYQSLGEFKLAGEISPRAELIATYALCGFANIASIAIQIGGIGGLAPTRKADLARLGMRALLGGSLATFMTATIAGLLN